jgi:hypothetical protein
MWSAMSLCQSFGIADASFRAGTGGIFCAQKHGSTESVEEANRPLTAHHDFIARTATQQFSATYKDSRTVMMSVRSARGATVTGLSKNNDTYNAESAMQANDKKTIVGDLPEWVGAKMMTVAGILVTAAGYFVGYVRYQGYLKVFHVSVSAFPMDHAEYLLQGARAGGSFVLGLLTSDKYSLRGLVLCLICILCAAFLWLLMWTVHGSPTSRRNNIKASFTRSLCSFIRSCVQIALGALILTAAISVPGIIGAVSGLSAGNESRDDFNKGCAHAKATCISLSANGKALVEGFRITQSKDRIAMYIDGVTREYDLAGKELATVAR